MMNKEKIDAITCRICGQQTNKKRACAIGRCVKCNHQLRVDCYF